MYEGSMWICDFGCFGLTQGNDTNSRVHRNDEVCVMNRGGSRPSQHSQLRMSDFLASRFSNLTNLSTQIKSDFSRLLTPVPTDICCTLGIPQGSGNLAIVIK